jgi:hypothetical protein
MNSVSALFQAGTSMSGGGMAAMMTACVLFGVLLFIALLELVIFGISLDKTQAAAAAQ